MLTYPWKCTVLHCNHLGNTCKPLVLMTRHFDYWPSASEGDNQSVGSSAPVVSRCFPGGYNVKLYISRGRLAWWLLAFLHSAKQSNSLQSTGFNVVDLFNFDAIRHYRMLRSYAGGIYISSVWLKRHILCWRTDCRSIFKSLILVALDHGKYPWDMQYNLPFQCFIQTLPDNWFCCSI